MMLYHCYSCRFWNPPILFRDGSAGKGDLFTYELGECMSGRLLNILHTRRPEEPSKAKRDDAFIQPETAALKTGPMFGCAHHQPKAPDESQIPPWRAIAGTKEQYDEWRRTHP